MIEKMLDNSNVVTLYEQIKSVIKDDIINGVYNPGDQLPNEKQLCEQYNVSRITIRRALKELSKEGLIEIRQGKGTFVSKEKLDIKILDLGGYTDTLESLHHNVKMQIIEKPVIKADKEVASALNIKEGDEVLKLKRLVLDQNDPLSIDIAYFPLSLYPNIIDKITDNISTFNLIKKDYKITMARAYKEFGVVLAQDEYSELLECTPGEPLFSIKKIIYDIDNKPVHYSTYYVLANKVKYYINVDMLSDKHYSNH